MMKATLSSLVLLATACIAVANSVPTVAIQSAAMRPDSTLMDVVYQITDPDDATVKVRALAFVDGVRSFANVLRPVTFAEGTETNLGDAIATGVDHTLTWDVAADWSIDLGQVKFEVLCLDARGLVELDWITLPAAGGNPAMSVSKDSPATDKVLDALFWQYADGNPDIALADGTLSVIGSDSVFEGVELVTGAILENDAAAFVFKEMDRKLASVGDVRFAAAARANPLNSDRWHALDEAYDASHTLVLNFGAGFAGFSPPVGLTDTVAISAGPGHSLALGADGSVSGWGVGRDGETIPPAGLVATAIAACDDFSVALKADGTVVAWGDDRDDQVTYAATLSDVTAIAAGYEHALALKSDGTVVGWGSRFSDFEPPAGLSNVTAIVAGDDYSLALKDDGTVVPWGDLPPLAGLTDVTAISGGREHVLALKADGTVVGWGESLFEDYSPPAGLTNVVMIEAGDRYNFAIKDDGEIVTWGSKAIPNASWMPPVGIKNVKAISAGVSHTVVILKKPAE